jgi:fumarate hydratase subunit alpha
MIREIHVDKVQSAVKNLIEEAAYLLPEDYLDALEEAQQLEQSPVGQSIILMLRDNADYSQKERIPTCQDTGMAIISLAIGQDVHFTGGDLKSSLESAVREAYGPLRKSIVADPLQRTNTGDNTPPIVTYEIVPGDQVEINVMMKGFGAELMSRLAMFPPSVGLHGIRQFVLETVEKAGPNACPPVIVGVGLGSTFDGVAALAKKALFRPLNEHNPISHLAELERQWRTVTALAVNIESYPTHIASIPVAVNLNCSAPRRAKIRV